MECEKRAAVEWQGRNREHVKERKRDWYHSRPEGYATRKHMESRLRQMGYGENELPTIIAWVLEHGDECDICHEPAAGYRWARLHLDHDEKTGAIRGMLCPPCNMSIGKFDHSVARLKAAIDYLQSDLVFEPGKVGW